VTLGVWLYGNVIESAGEQIAEENVWTLEL
jgi:hypothetical protein